MCQKTISMCQGKGSLSHNNRAFAAKNIDSSRTADNITFVHQNLRDAYDILFSDAVERYNARQKRNDRRIPDYFQHLFSREPSESVITGTKMIQVSVLPIRRLLLPVYGSTWRAFQKEIRISMCSML